MKEKKYIYDYCRASVTVDALIFDGKTKSKILLIERKNDPYKNFWALPGGFIEMDENLIDSIKRELSEETNLKNIELQQFKTYGNIGRDPRGRTISIVFYGFCDNLNDAVAGDDAKNIQYFDIYTLPNLAFDHNVIISDFVSEKLNRK